MKNSKLIQLLSAVKPKEIKLLRQFVASPYFNQQQEVVQLLSYLLKYYPDFLEEDITKEKVYQAVLPNTAFNKKLLGYWMSDLVKLCMSFFKQQELEKDDTLEQYYIHKQLLDRKLWKLYQANDKKWKANFTHKIQSGDLFYEQFRNAYLANYYFHLQKKRQTNENLELMSKNLDLFYFSNKLKISSSILSNQKVFSTTQALELHDEIITYIRAKEIDHDHTIIKLLLYTNLLLDENNDKKISYQDFFQFLVNSDLNVNKEDLLFAYQVGINYAARRLREGKIEYANYVLDLYLDGIEKEILFDESGYLSPWTFKNVVKLALGLKKLEFAEKFIHQNITVVDKAFQENAFHYNLAELYYFKKDYDNAKVELNKTEFTDVYYALDAKSMLLKIYYEMDDDTPLLSLIASFTLYLKRRKNISKQIKATYLNFCTILNQIVRKNPKKLEHIKQTIKEKPLLADRRWLMEQVKQWEESL